MLYYLIYCSTAVHLLGDEALNVLLQQARTRNRELVITGMLVYVEGMEEPKQGRFMQVLEGSRFLVESVFEKIENDGRHRDIIVLERAAISKRNFKTWDMGFATIDEFPAEDTPLDFLKSFYKEQKDN